MPERYGFAQVQVRGNIAAAGNATLDDGCIARAAILGIDTGINDKHRCGKLRIYHHELLKDIVHVGV